MKTSPANHLLNPLKRFAKKIIGKNSPSHPFDSSESYWIRRYAAGGNSGDGSYNHLATFKAEVINQFVDDHAITTVIEYGCGDGNQLTLANYPSYLGFDVSPQAIKTCREKFADYPTFQFHLVDDYKDQTAMLTLSLDVIFHLVEDDVFDQYMQRLFDSAEKFVGIYSSNLEQNPPDAPHVRHRKFTDWIEENRPMWQQSAFVPNRYPYSGNNRTGSFADFYFFTR